jgi:glycosyltransferase involved in cell wall biosynthesis
VALRILQVSAYYPPHVGGLESHVEALSRKLVEAGHEVVVYTSNVPKGRRYEVVDGVEVHRFKCLFAPLGNPVIPGLLVKLLERDRFDVVHTHVHYHISSTFAVLANVFARRPLVLTSHGTILGYQGWKRAFEAIFDRTVGKWTLGSADRIIALSSTQSDKLEELGAERESVTVIAFWMELDQVSRQADAADFRSRYDLGDRKIVLFVGRLLPAKGLDYLIEAAKHTQTKPAIVIIGGEAPGYGGTKRSLEQKIQQLGLERDVLMLGAFPKEKLGAAYVAGDLFVLPSLGEGLPVALLEAMSYGKCVLATNVSGNRDVVEDGRNGLLVEPQNPVELARKIDHLLSDDGLRERLGKEARRDIERKYGADAIVARILDLYREVQKQPSLRMQC